MAAAEKDKVVFVDKEEEESNTAGYASDDSAEEGDERMGAVGPDGEIDWDCPCLNLPLRLHVKQAGKRLVCAKGTMHVISLVPQGTLCLFPSFTNEVNSGMTKGPCGAPFKEAFACFVHSSAEPKGEDCLMEMKAMHDCIMAHPEHFESNDDEDSDEEGSDDESKDEPEEKNKEERSGKSDRETKQDTA